MFYWPTRWLRVCLWTTLFFSTHLHASSVELSTCFPHLAEKAERDPLLAERLTRLSEHVCTGLPGGRKHNRAYERRERLEAGSSASAPAHAQIGSSVPQAMLGGENDHDTLFFHSGTPPSNFDPVLEGSLAADLLERRTEDCVDDNVGLLSWHYLLTPFTHLLTCSNVITMLNRDMDAFVSLVKAMPTATMINESLVREWGCFTGPDFRELCLNLEEGTPEDCDGVAGVRLEQVCCATCQGINATTDTNGTSGTLWHLADLDLNETEAQAFHDFIVALNPAAFADWTIRDLCDHRSSDASRATFIECRGDGTYWVRIEEDYGIDGYISPSVGYLENMKIFTITVAPELQGTIPEELGMLGDSLQQLEFRNLPGLIGEVPSSLCNLTSMTRFSIDGTSLGGMLDPALFLNWTGLTTVQIQNNDFSGAFPDIDFAATPALVIVKASNNSFSSLGNVGLGDFSISGGVLPRFELTFANNKLTEFPEQLKYLSRLSVLNLKNNLIEGLPSWGYWQKELPFFVYGNEPEPGQLEECWWKFGEDPERIAPPTWPLLTSVALDGNNFAEEENDYYGYSHSSLRRLLAVFSYANSLTTLTCQSCGLSGNLKTIATSDSDGIEYHEYLYLSLMVRDGFVASTAVKNDCVAVQAFENLRVVDFSYNPGIRMNDMTCEVFEVNDEADVDDRFQCGQCTEGSVVPSGAQIPLSSLKDCVCPSDRKTYNVEEGIVCGCSDNYWIDTSSDTCTSCSEEFNCSWDTGRASMQLPPLRAGYWMPCTSQDNFSRANLWSCYSERTCFGGDVDSSIGNCTDTTPCANGRTGRACGLCQPGFYGGADDECLECGMSVWDAQKSGLMTALIMIPIVYAGVLVFGYDDQAATRARQLALEGGAGWLNMYYRHRRSLQDIKGMARLIFKYMQLLAVLSSLKVTWPEDTRVGLDWAEKVGIKFDRMFRAGCMQEQQTTSFVLLFQCIAPIGFLVIVLCTGVLATVLDEVLYRILKLLGLRAYAANARGSIRLNSMLVITFAYMVWSCYFAGLVSNSFEVFICKENPNGIRTVATHPDLICGEGNWWFHALGGILSLLVYVVAWFVASYIAVRQVAKTLKRKKFEVRGAFEFAVECLRTSKIYWNIYAAGRDVLVSGVVAVFYSQPAMQVVLAAVVLMYYAKDVFIQWPYESYALNMIEIWFCAVTSLLIVFTAAVGMEGSVIHVGESGIALSSDDDVANVYIVFGLLVSSIAVPVMVLIYHVICLIPGVKDLMPRLIRRESADDIASQVGEFRSFVPAELLVSSLQVMDAAEWRAFLTTFSGRPSFRGFLQSTEPSSCWGISLDHRNLSVSQRMVYQHPEIVERYSTASWKTTTTEGPESGELTKSCKVSTEKIMQQPTIPAEITASNPPEIPSSAECDINMDLSVDRGAPSAAERIDLPKAASVQLQLERENSPQEVLGARCGMIKVAQVSI